MAGLYVHRFEGRYEMKLRAWFSHQPSTDTMFISRVAVSIIGDWVALVKFAVCDSP